MKPLDATDRALLDLLRANARRPIAELARELGVARTTVQSRIERLERDRVVTGYTISGDRQLESTWVRAHVMITAGSKQTGAIEAGLRAMPELRSLYSVSGAFDLLAVLAAPTMESLNAVIDRIGSLSGVERTNSAIVLSVRIER